jgi:hypothetical protein
MTTSLQRGICWLLLGVAVVAGLEAFRQTLIGPGADALSALPITNNRRGGLWIVSLACGLFGAAGLRPAVWKHGLFVFLALVLLFLANNRRMGSTDSVPNSFLPFAVLRHGSLTLDAFPSAAFAEGREQPCVRMFGAHRLACAGIGVSLVALPVFVLPALFTADPTDAHRILLDKLAATLLTALSAWWMWRVFSVLLEDDRKALSVLAVYATGTSLLTIASQTMWQFTGVVFGFSLALYALFAMRHTTKAAALVGVGCGIAVVSRQLSLILVLWVLVELCRSRRAFAPVAIACIAASPLALMLFAYNTTYFGAPLATGYGAVEGLFEPSAERFFGYLISPARGLLVYCPIVVVAAVGLAKRAWPLLGAVLTHILVLGAWVYWDGGYSSGPRLWTDMAPFVGLGLAMAWRAYCHTTVFRLTATYSVAMHLMLMFIPAPDFARAMHMNLARGAWEPRAYAPYAYFVSAPPSE